MARVGIVCEGSHDFLFLQELADELLLATGHQNNIFDSLQPRVDATSQQIDGGGYEAVHQWVRSNAGVGLCKFFEANLFATSTVYDYLIFQVDGDVADLSSDFAASPFAELFQSVSDRVQAVSSWLLSTARAEPIHCRKVIPAVPTLQTEAWIVAALRPNAIHVEDRPRKKSAKRFLRLAYGGSAASQVSKAGKDTRLQLNSLIGRAVSFKAFADQVNARCR